MNWTKIISIVIGLVVGAGGIFAYDATKEACDGIPERAVSAPVNPAQ